MNNQRIELAAGSFKDQVIVITGAGRGIGRAAALLFAQHAASVVLAEISDDGAELEQEITASGGRALYVQTDISDEKQVASLLRRTQETYGEADILINNAIYCPLATVLEMSLEMWERVMSVNLRGAFLTCKAFLPGMIARGQGSIINMVSTDAMPGLSAYIASKKGLSGFSQSIQAEMQPYGIRVAAFAPGMVDTPAIRQIAPGLSRQLGITETQFTSLSLHPDYEGLMPVEDAAAATALLAAYYMAEYDGETIDGYTILERAGWISQTDIPQAGEPGSPQPEPAGRELSGTSAQTLNQALIGILRETMQEFEQLPLFARPMAMAGFKRKAGLRLQDWLRTVEALDDMLSSHTGLTADTARIEETRQRLKSLSLYYRDVPAETARFTKDKALLEMVQQKTTERMETIRRLGETLDR